MDVGSPIGVAVIVAALTMAMREVLWIYKTTIKKEGTTPYHDGGKSYHSKRLVEDAILKLPDSLRELNTNLVLSNERLIQLAKESDRNHQSIVMHLSEIKHHKE